MQRISRFRMIVFIVIILAMIGVFSLRLYKTQAAVTEESLVAADADSMTYQSTVEAARGNILDRNGNVLVSNRASYNLVIVNFVFFNAPDPNGNLLKVLDLCDELGIQYESHFPVTPDRPYEYTDDNNSAWQENFRKFLADRGYDLDISAPTLVTGSGPEGSRGVCSALHFEPVQDDVEWCVEFLTQPFDDADIPLL